jgi:hypothetical protein
MTVGDRLISATSERAQRQAPTRVVVGQIADRRRATITCSHLGSVPTVAQAIDTARR